MLPNGMPFILTKDRLDRLNFDDALPYRDALDVLLGIDRNLAVLTKLNSISKGFISRSVSIGTNPTLIFSSARPKAIIVLNPSLSAGLTSSGTLLALTARGPGSYNSQTAPLGVANYLRISLFLNITANALPHTLAVDAQSRDQLSLNWLDTQDDVFAGTNAIWAAGANGYYAQLGPMGVDVEFAINATVGAGAGTMTFSVSYTLKEGLPGTSTGIASTIFLGPNDAVNSTSYPLLSGDKFPLLVTENTELWGVALAAGQTVNVFELS